ncbi:MAG: DUF998 domain-containing protein [Anaerolineales bacterium]
MKISRILSICGLLAAGVYLLVVLIASTQFPGYSHASEYISNLGAKGQPSAGIMNAGFVLVGLFMMLFGVSTFVGFKRNWAAVIGGIFLIAEGLTETLSGIFSCDPGCNALNPTTDEMIHNTVGPLGFIFLIFAAILWALRFRKQSGWKSFWVFSLITGIVGIVLFGIFGMAVGTPTVGVWQRLLWATLFLWIALFSYRLWSKWEEVPFTLDEPVETESLEYSTP